MLSAYGWVVLILGAVLATLGLFAPIFSGTPFFLFVGGLMTLIGGIAIVAAAAVIAVLTPTTPVSSESPTSTAL